MGVGVEVGWFGFGPADVVGHHAGEFAELADRTRSPHLADRVLGCWCGREGVIVESAFIEPGGGMGDEPRFGVGDRLGIPAGDVLEAAVVDVDLRVRLGGGSFADSSGVELPP